ncbi:glycosyltransferase family 1 protein [candidate division WOR-3 bacterium]|uniref:Glycosyltransferase family 1 protein n=1 Tax=candidate division WOR-3 bacterium TaxID=2052148 RepID=A0A660SGQ7_UNCW3|nr:MAG: glycosyltransferase family 1 protein [candidate division WOR-3 bacterium]
MNILLSAYACEPNKGSEPGIGWNWVKEISRYHEVWVITRANNRKVIEEALRKEPMPNVHWIYYDLPKWLRFWKKGQRGIHLYYYLWQIGIYFVARRLHQRIRFDIIHHVTFGTYWLPSFLSLLPGRFVWGPVGGGERTPFEFYSFLSLKDKIYEFIRNLAQRFCEFDPFVRMTARNATIAFAATEDTARRMSVLGCHNVKIFSNVGVEEALCGSQKNYPIKTNKIFRIFSIGRFIYWKNFQLGLKAFAKFQKMYPNSEYWLIGDGPERRKLENLAVRLGIRDKVKFLGKLSRHNVLEILKSGSVLLHPSLHDSGGWVISEAMVTGLPVICLDLGGCTIQVTKETGFKIPANNADHVVNNIVEAMINLARDPQLRHHMGYMGRRHIAEHFCWRRKGKIMNYIYCDVAYARTK